jgi:hypothetical protein
MIETPPLPPLPPNGRYVLLIAEPTSEQAAQLAARLGLDPARDVIVTASSGRVLQGLRGSVEVIVHESWPRAPLEVQLGVARDLEIIERLYP